MINKEKFRKNCIQRLKEFNRPNVYLLDKKSMQLASISYIKKRRLDTRVWLNGWLIFPLKIRRI